MIENLHEGFKRAAPEMVMRTKTRMPVQFNKLVRGRRKKKTLKGLKQSFLSIHLGEFQSMTDPHLTFWVLCNLVYFRIKKNTALSPLEYLRS